VRQSKIILQTPLKKPAISTHESSCRIVSMFRTRLRQSKQLALWWILPHIIVPGVLPDKHPSDIERQRTTMDRTRTCDLR
jgi:hypothetical protein